MYGCAFGVEIGAFRNAPPLRSAQLSSVRTGECGMVKNNKSERDWLTVTEACERADVSPNTIKNWVAAYGIGLKVAGRFRIIPEKLDEVLRGEAVKH
jgi:hypothetical protein